jgi:phosphoesterase RecJ-like protein
MYSYLTELYDLQSQTFSPSVVISVDAGSLSQLGDFMNPCEGILLSIDHHDSNTMYASYNLVDSSYASCCEIVYELIDTLSVKLDEYIASAIYTGVSTDTGCFKYRNTTANAHYVTARLIETDIDLGMLNRVLFESKTKEFLQLQQLAIASLKFYLDDKIAVTTVTRDMFELSGAVEEDMTNISPLARAIDGVEVGLTFRETPKGSIKCSVRSSDKVDASAICRLFGGGGHKGAAAFECTGDMTEIQTKTIDTVISFLKNSE